MKKDIHPKTYLATFRCACGSSFETLSTQKEVTLDICSACHPYYTGKQKFVDIAGRVERFNRRYSAKAKA
jgi:large subunit ribosomal protein L31